MATVPASPDQGTYGISRTLAGYTIESENITTQPLVEPVTDQKNATVNEIKYDTRLNLKLTVRGSTAPTISNTFSYDSKTWSVDEVEEAGTYNGLKRYNISAHRFDNFPASTGGSGTQS